MTRTVVGAPRERDRIVTGRGRRFAAPGRPRSGEHELVPEVRRLPDGDRLEERPRNGGQPPNEAGGRRRTLGDLVTGAWEDLLSAGSAPCPACGERMSFREGAGRCSGCGARLS